MLQDFLDGLQKAAKPKNLAIGIVGAAILIGYANSNLPGGPAVGRFLGLRS